MNLGQLDRQLTLQQPAPAPANLYGGPGQQATFTDVATVWGKVEPVAGGEALSAEQLMATTRQKITIRYRPDVQADWQLVLDGRLYHITDVQQLGRRVGLILAVYSRGLLAPTPALPAPIRIHSAVFATAFA